jgi:hypothetical protein
MFWREEAIVRTIDYDIVDAHTRLMEAGCLKTDHCTVTDAHTIQVQTE